MAKKNRPKPVLQKNKTQKKIKSQPEGVDHKSTDSDSIGHAYCYPWGWGSLLASRIFRRIRSVLGGLRWQRGLIRLLICTTVMIITLVALGLYRIYFDRTNLPALEPFTRFEFATIGHVYDANGQPLVEMAREYRRNIRYQDIPPVVRDAILAAEDKNFFTHNGVDYSVIPRVLSKIRFGTLATRITTLSREDEAKSEAIFPHGGSTITQQLVRCHFLKNLTSFQNMTTQENSDQLLHGVLLPRALSYLIGSHSVNMLVRKLEEIRLSLWVEKKMQERFGSKRRAKEELLARYASLIYMGNGQYGFAVAAEYYFGRSLATFTADDADLAALLASIAKSPLHYAPGAKNTERVLHRRNQSLALMAANGFISPDRLKDAEQRPIQAVVGRKNKALLGSAVVSNVLEELKGRHANLSIEDLLQGRIQIYSTVEARVQQIVDDALEHGLALYEKRRPAAKGLIQGSVVVLRNRDASILAETGGRRLYQDRSSSYSDFNRVTKSLRQPGSAMKPIVYLAAFQQGIFNLDTLVPDEPISVPDKGNQQTKWISNYDGQFKGMIPLREALAQSRNAVAIWITERIGMDSVMWMARSLGIQTPLSPYVTTALGASEVNLLELANAYRTMASGIFAKPYVIRKIVSNSGEVLADNDHSEPPVDVVLHALALIQEGLRGIVRMPSGTAHTLEASDFPIPVMGKTGTTNGFRDALFVGSTYGPEGITIAVRIGFDDNRSLGHKETGGRVALPVFRKIMLNVYRKMLAGPVPAFPVQMEQRINNYLKGDPADDAPAPEENIPQNIEAPPNTEAKRITPNQAAALSFSSNTPLLMN
ncbi:MAG: multimodular transpeptidase-transglycosylase [Syntrophaceae bacterium]|nr:MAG: multimodular transpeptidase-transglycosylase [Syntrophaceae bacterium]